MYKKRKIIHVVATDLKGAIGAGNQLPWKCKADLADFKSRTMNAVCIIGANTYRHLPSKLPGRELVVLSRHFKYSALPDNVTLANSLAQALEIADRLIIEKGLQENILVIGGGEIYHLTSRITDEVHRSIIDTTASDATHFYNLPEEVVVHEHRYKPD